MMCVGKLSVIEACEGGRYSIKITFPLAYYILEKIYSGTLYRDTTDHFTIQDTLIWSSGVRGDPL